MNPLPFQTQPFSSQTACCVLAFAFSNTELYFFLHYIPVLARKFSNPIAGSLGSTWKSCTVFNNELIVARASQPQSHFKFKQLTALMDLLQTAEVSGQKRFVVLPFYAEYSLYLCAYVSAITSETELTNHIKCGPYSRQQVQKNKSSLVPERPTR